MKRYRDINYTLATPEQRAHEDDCSRWCGLRDVANRYLDGYEVRRQTPGRYLRRRWHLASELLCSPMPSIERLDPLVYPLAVLLPLAGLWILYTLTAHVVAIPLACPWPREPLERVVVWRMIRLADRIKAHQREEEEE